MAGQVQIRNFAKGSHVKVSTETWLQFCQDESLRENLKRGVCHAVDDEAAGAGLRPWRIHGHTMAVLSQRLVGTGRTD